MRSGRFYSQGTNISSSNIAWLSVAAALAGATLSSRRRSLAQSRSAEEDGMEDDGEGTVATKEKKVWRNRRGLPRNVHVYGGKTGAIKAPLWLHGWQPTTPEQEGMSPAKKQGPQPPSWLTFDKWSSFNKDMKCRSVNWYKRRFDSKGEYRFERKAGYTIRQAVQLIMDMYADAPMGIDVTLEIIMKMNLDPKFPDQQLRANITLPNGSGKKQRVAVFCSPDDEEDALKMGAHKAGKTLSEDIDNEIFDFDVLIAKPAMMPALAKLGKILGPRKMMPSPKQGTVVQDLEAGIKQWSGGSNIQLKTCLDHNVVHAACGKLSMGEDKLVENFRATLQGVCDKVPQGFMTKKAKGKKPLFIEVKMGSTQSPSIKIDKSEWPEVVRRDDGPTIVKV